MAQETAAPFVIPTRKTRQHDGAMCFSARSQYCPHDVIQCRNSPHAPATQLDDNRGCARGGGGGALMTSTRWLSTMALRVTTPSYTTAQMTSSYIARIPPTHPLLSWATIAVALGGELLMTSTRWLSTMALRVTTPSHSAHLGNVLRASPTYSRPSLVGRHIGTTYVT